MKLNEIEDKIKAGLNCMDVIVASEDSVHFQVTVISEDFEGVSRVKRQQMVYALLNEQILDGTLHAIALKTVTPTQWDGLKGK